MQGLAGPGLTTSGWFYAFKLHLVINHRGEIMAGNTDDRAVLDRMTAGLQGHVVADKGCISKNSSRRSGAAA